MVNEWGLGKVLGLDKGLMQVLCGNNANGGCFLSSIMHFNVYQDVMN